MSICTSLVALGPSNFVHLPKMVTFTVHRSRAVLVPPASTTRHEYKALSDIDDQAGLRFYETGIHFFRSHPSRKDQDPAVVVKEALAKALVYYYPIAGRLRELPGGKLVVDCTGEGVVFVEANAGAWIEDFGDAPVPPFPCIEELIYEPEGRAQGVINSPLMYIQVTRLRCGGFTLGYAMCHNIMDGAGAAQFLTAMGELARGAEIPSIFPVWGRELLTARAPPLVTHVHPEYEPIADGRGEEKDVVLVTPPELMVHQSFFFGEREISALRNQAPPHLMHCSTRFELITAAAWRCRTAALGYAPGSEVRVMFTSNARGRWKRNPPLPVGFYGNGLTLCVVAATASELCSNSLGFALELVRAAKSTRSEEYLQSTMDLMVLRGRPCFTMEHTFFVSDVVNLGFAGVDFGWGEPAYGGPAMIGDVASRLPSVFTRCKNANGEEGIVVPVCLPMLAMERFQEEIDSLFTQQLEKGF